MIVSTTPTLEGRRISEYRGIVSGEAVMGVNMFRDMFAAIRDIVGGRAGAYEKELKNARDLAMDDMIAEAVTKGANAVVGVDLDYEVLGKSMLMVSANGTAVVIDGE